MTSEVEKKNFKQTFKHNIVLSLVLHVYVKFQLNREVSQNELARFHDRQTSEVK